MLTCWIWCCWCNWKCKAAVCGISKCIRVHQIGWKNGCIVWYKPLYHMFLEQTHLSFCINSYKTRLTTCQTVFNSQLHYSIFSSSVLLWWLIVGGSMFIKVIFLSLLLAKFHYSLSGCSGIKPICIEKYWFIYMAKKFIELLD